MQWSLVRKIFGFGCIFDWLGGYTAALLRLEEFTNLVETMRILLSAKLCLCSIISAAAAVVFPVHEKKNYSDEFLFFRKIYIFILFLYISYPK